MDPVTGSFWPSLPVTHCVNVHTFLML
jgi:hypothetical protein